MVGGGLGIIHLRDIGGQVVGRGAGLKGSGFVLH